MQIDSYNVLILGAGSGGISVAAKLCQSLDPQTICVVDAAQNHYYQPLWTIAGAGLMKKEVTQKPQTSVIPHGVTWIQSSVERISPDQKQVTLANGRTLNYKFLIVATGLRLAWEKIAGLEGNLGKNGICSVYEYNQVDFAAKMIQSFAGGRAIFTMPAGPIKCAGAPQKIMYLADRIFRNHGVREKCEINFATAGKAMFGIPVFSKALELIVKEKDIKPLFQHKLIAVLAEKREAVFLVTDDQGKSFEKTLSYDLLHVVPPMMAHEFISDSGLAFKEGDQKAWLAVDKYTLQHLTYPNIFGVGDVTGVPNSKTGAAIRKQYPIVAANLLSAMKNEPLLAKYDGYSSCPLITDIGKVMLAEFGYDGKLMPTFPLDPTVPRRSMWFLKKYLLPKLYWYGMLKGRA